MTINLVTGASGRGVASVSKALSWEDIDRDMKLAMLLVADGMMNMLGHSVRARHAAETFLGVSFPEGLSGFVVSEASEAWKSENSTGFMAAIKTDDTHLHRCLSRAYSLLTDLKPLSEVDVQDERDQAIDWIKYFLSAIPTDTYGMGDDFSGVALDLERPLPLVCRLSESYLSLVDFVQRTVGAGASWSAHDSIVFTADDLAALAGVDVRSVRNAMGPSAGKPIRSFKASPGVSEDERAYADPVDAIEWLSGRRSFFCGSLDAAYVDAGVGDTSSVEALCALAGMMSWLNGGTTESMAAQLRWDAARTRSWTRGLGVDPESAFRVAQVAGLDPQKFSNRVRELLAKEDRS